MLDMKLYILKYELVNLYLIGLQSCCIGGGGEGDEAIFESGN